MDVLVKSTALPVQSFPQSHTELYDLNLVNVVTQFYGSKILSRMAACSATDQKLRYLEKVKDVCLGPTTNQWMPGPGAIGRGSKEGFLSVQD